MEGNMPWFDNYLQGHCCDAYRYMGTHKDNQHGKDGFVFRVYAPLAKEVYLFGDFFSWKPLMMNKIDDRGLYELFVPGVELGQKYKYHILGCDGIFHDKQDPFAFADELRSESCSYVVDLNGIHIDDATFLESRDRNFDKPVSVYEFHFGTWKRKDDNTFYNYSELADVMIPYLKDMGYTHIECMPLTAYPNDSSWGYQALGFFAVDRRWGTLKDFAEFVTKMHQANIGIILDFVPVHFALDSFGLEKFDGSCVYEYANEHEFSPWGSKYFDLTKDPVRSFLISSLCYFADVFHLDGFRFDSLSHIIYWDGEVSHGVNYGGLEFVKRANGYVHSRFPSLMMMAEDSSAFGHVTKGFASDSLGFDYKWDLGWMNDTLKYYAKDPLYKKFCHNQLTFSMAYFYSENFVLALSHDEVVHMKGSVVNKMWGTYDNKFANVRNLYAYQFAHPGKKLNFMGNELAAFDEWKEFEPISFQVLGYPKHAGVQRLIRDLNRIYVSHPAMYKGDYSPMSFGWIMADNSEQSVYVFRRECEEECMIFLFNMTSNFYWDYNVGVPYEGTYEEILNTDKDVYGGWNQYNGLPLVTSGSGIHNQKYRLVVKLPSFGAVYLVYRKNNTDSPRPYVHKEGAENVTPNAENEK